jgi:hypothetical protein
VELSSHRMALTLAGLGPRPVIDLHAAGLKAGELALKNPSGITEDGLARIVNPKTL